MNPGTVRPFAGMAAFVRPARAGFPELCGERLSGLSLRPDLLKLSGVSAEMLITPGLASREARGLVYNSPANIVADGDLNAMLDWIKKRAAEARKQEKYSLWQAQKARLIGSHSQEFFEELSALMAKSVAAFNAEFKEPERQIGSYEPGLNRFVVERKSDPAVRVECRLDHPKHSVHYQISRTLGPRRKVYQTESTLEFDVSAKKEIMMRTFDAIPMSLQQVTQLLLEPFFVF